MDAFKNAGPETVQHGSRVIDPRHRRYALALLFAAYAVNYVDRQVITILQDSIKADMGLSDLQLGMITGFSFALFYALLGLPIGRLADRLSRKAIIGSSMALWSVMTALCSVAQGFFSLMLLRVGVGVGEAGLTPAAHSLLSDYYPPARRASALAIYSSAGTVGLMLGFLIGGIGNSYFGWRTALVFAGLPGILLSVLVWTTMREPQREILGGAGVGLASASGGFTALLRDPAFLCIMLGCGFHAFVNFGQGNWTPPFLSRLHGMTSAQIGAIMAILSIGPGLFGMLMAGYVADWLTPRRPHARLEVAMISILLAAATSAAAFSTTDKTMCLTLLGTCFMLAGGYLAPCIATVHAMVPPNLRATASALVMLSVNLIGLGGGPLAVGAISDILGGMGFGTEGLRWSLVAIIPMQLVAVLLFGCARAIDKRRYEA